MSGSAPKFTANTWKKLMVLGQKQGSIKLSDLAPEMGLGEEETLAFLRQVFPMGIGAEIYHQDNQCWVDIDASAIQYMLPLSPAEWIQLHHVLAAVSVKDVSHPELLNSLKKKVTDNGPIKVVMELLQQLEVWDQQLSEGQQAMITQLDQAVSIRGLVKMRTNDGKDYFVYPCRVLHLEGKISVVAEDSKDHCLSIISLSEVHSLTPIETSGFPKVSGFEVEEFISAVRAMNEKETRLILKIHEPQSVNLFPDHHFLGKPCMVTNPNGDLIWAAYVEPCEGLFEWLITLGKKVEILDPTNFRQEFLGYCEDKVRKIA
jgi:predicted DNA-binding transcriptional regulator YafY